MKRDLPPYIYPKGRAGHLWFVRRGWQSQRIFSKYPSAEFYVELAKIQKGIAPVPSNKNFRVLIAKYRQSEKFTKKKPRTQSDYDKILAFIDDRYGDKDPTKLRRHNLIKLRDDNKATIRFANYCVQIMRILMEFAIDEGWQTHNHARGVLLLQSESPSREPWPADLIQDYRDTATDRTLLLFELLIGTGQRIGDVLKMKWGQIGDGGITVKQGKTGKELFIPLTPRLKTVLSATERKSVFILTNLHATGPWSYRGAADAVMKIRKAIGATKYDIHALRHTAASELYEAGCSDDQVKAITGHESTASVIRYAAKARQRRRATEAQNKRND